MAEAKSGRISAQFYGSYMNNWDITVSAVGGFHSRKNSHEVILKNGNRLPGAY